MWRYQGIKLSRPPLFKRWLQIAVMAVGVALGFTLTTTSITAQTAPLELSINPPVAYLHVKPGSNQTHTLTLQHHGTVPLEAIIKVVDFVPDGETGQPILTDVSTFPYLTLLNPNERLGEPFPLVPGKAKKLSFNIDVPNSATQKEYPLTILINTQPNSQYSVVQTGSQLGGTIASNVIILVSESDRLPRRLTIDSLTGPRFLDSFSTLKFDLKLKNVSLQAAPASGSARLKNWQGKTLKEWQLYPDMVLGSATRFARGLDPTAAEPTPVEFTYRGFLIGPYSIEAQLNNQGGQQELLTVKMIALPWSLGLLLIIGVILLGLGKYFSQKDHLDKTPKSV
ncbi:MAG TPA: hypothetical protein VD999_02010 [Vitreimonas sp.]|nr:hypothetical protein [Vitreimonas sp.]